MFELRVLGAVGLRGPDGSQLNAVLSQAKALALLSYLALNAPRGTQRRDSLLALFWPDLDLPHARNALNQALHRLRRSLGESAITSHGSSDVGLSLEECWCDAVAFERSLEGGAYAEALELYRGALLPGVYVSGAPGFERWLEQERTRLQQRAFQAARQLADQRGHEEGPGAAVPWLRRACDFDPTDDRTVRSLMEALAGSGDVRGALQTYDEYVSRLAADVHLSPSAETAASAERLRSIGRAGVPPHRAHWPPRIAVLPFLDLSPATDHAHLSDGITGAIISQLGRIGGLEVISQTSTMSLKHSAKPLKQIATLLDVGAVVEGSVLPAMNRVRITVQLIEVRPERHLWTKEYERDLRDVLALEREVALDIARGVRVTIAAQSERTLGTLRPVNEAALEAYLRGLALLNQFSTASIRASLDHFTTAIVTDPDYAPPYVGLADAYILLGHGDLPTNEAFEKARTALTTALKLDAGLAEAHASLAHIAFEYDRDYAALQREYRRAVELNPSYSSAYHVYAQHLMLTGRRKEAEAALQRALHFDPLSRVVYTDLGKPALIAGDYETAIPQFRRALELYPDFPVARGHLVLAYLAQDRAAEAIPLLEQAVASGGLSRTMGGANVGINGWLGYAYARVGRTADAQAVLDMLHARAREEYVWPLGFALVYTGLGDTDGAFAWLDSAAAEGVSQLSWIKAYVPFQVLSSDPRFSDLARRLGLPL